MNEKIEMVLNYIFNNNLIPTTFEIMEAEKTLNVSLNGNQRHSLLRKYYEICVSNFLDASHFTLSHN
jgi:hypothetical protein